MAAKPADVDDSTWEVPAHRVPRARKRTADWAVVIPVINEGERISRLLARMAALGIAGAADIVIVDGGSTDGSLADDVLDAGEVNTLIVKEGPGRLSAQLRCAYAHVLRAGYAGVVTIDGNDKDDPEAIPRMVAALADGYDFVQGSRFAEGGRGINTPRSRRLAITLLHAPVLSWAARFRWTDTTQGFRAYSRALLADARLAIFRDVFSDYELLAYLSARAPRLGFRCVEMGTTREYPTDEVPTKISGLGAHAGLIGTLLRAAFGRYNPRGR